MPKRYAFLVDRPETFPHPNMTARDLISFHRDHPEQIEFHSTAGVLTADNFHKVLRKTGYVRTLGGTGEMVRVHNWQEQIDAIVAHGERSFREGRVDPDKVLNPAGEAVA